MSDPRASDRPPLRTRLREKLPEILIEAGSIVIALLLAQAVGVWHEHQEQRELAARARTAIISELRENAGELERMRTQTKTIVDDLNAAADPKQPPHNTLLIKMSLALLSGAAWHAALANGAIQHLDYTWTVRVAKVYELQDLVLHAQSIAADQITDVSDAEKDSPHDLALRLLSRQRALAQFADGLERGYRDVLDDKP
jgi:hypothetical protein